MQRELLQWFEKHTPSLVEPYVAAVTLLQVPDFPGRVTLVCFCMRDLGNILPLARSVDEAGKAPETPGSAAKAASKDLSGAKRKARSLLQALPQLNVTEDDVGLWIDEVHQLLKWFSDHHHFSHKQRECPSDSELGRNVESFEHALLRFTHTFFGLLERGEQIIKRVRAGDGVPTDSDADHLVGILEWSLEFQRPLLDRLGEEWLLPLRDRGVFTDPPPAEYVKGRGVRFPMWPPSSYLARMAALAPDEVAAIFAKIETDNASIIGDIVEAALAMPADVAVSLVSVIRRAVEEGTLSIRFKDASDLCLRLTEGDELDAAMELTETLFTPTFEKGQEEPNRRDKYWYKEGLKKIVPALARAKPRVFLPKLCDWLKASVEAKKHVHLESDSDSDYSYIWRPAIEEHEQNHDYYFAGVMAGFVREGFEEAIRNGSLSLEEAFQIVERYSYLIFRRIRLHLIAEFADQNRELARQTMLERGLFDDNEYKHEYAMLVGRRLDLLSPDQQDEWFGWIDAGPKGEDYTKEQAEYWTFQKLHWARAHLEGERKAFYERMLTEHGEPDMADMNVRTGGTHWGHDSPMTTDDLAGMTFEQAVDVVSSWRPKSSRFRDPTVEGLGSTFKQYVATNPAEFSGKARGLIGQPAIFVHSFISQMSEAAKAGREIDLAAVLDLCHWVIERPLCERTTPRQEHEGIVDKDWQWTRGEISHFIQMVCEAMSDENPRYPLDALREPMWKVIEQLCLDCPKSYMLRDIEKDDPRVHDYLDLGINSHRGKAVEAALEYARWVANHIKESEGEQETVPGGFKAMPEVKEMLEWQIAPENRSFEALSIIGSRIGLIYWIDKAWLAKHADSIFHLDRIEREPSTAHGWAAWNAFLVWVSPHIEFYRLFKKQFAYTVKEAARVNLADEPGEQPMKHLGKHLMIIYGRGQLGLDDDDGLLRRFLSKSVPEIRRDAVGFVGRSLGGDEKVPSEVVKRFMELWDYYWSGPGPGDATQAPDEWLFGPWFMCGQFPEDWSLERLEQFVEFVPTPEPNCEIVERLAQIASTNIRTSVRILDLMIRGDKEGWRVHTWLESIMQILRIALKADGEARKQAMQTIDYLGRRGYVECGRLLEGGGVPGTEFRGRSSGTEFRGRHT